MTFMKEQTQRHDGSSSLPSSPNILEINLIKVSMCWVSLNKSEAILAVQRHRSERPGQRMPSQTEGFRRQNFLSLFSYQTSVPWQARELTFTAAGILI